MFVLFIISTLINLLSLRDCVPQGARAFLRLIFEAIHVLLWSKFYQSFILVAADDSLYWARFCWRFLHLKGEFFLSTVTTCLLSMRDIWGIAVVGSLHDPGTTSRQWLNAICRDSLHRKCLADWNVCVIVFKWL